MAPTPLQHRKYLCQAPRPEIWVDLPAAVLSNLGATAERQLQETLAHVQATHPLQPRAGPGRKSNAEHAIHFYEFLLQQLRKRSNEKQGGEESNEEDSDNEEESDDNDNNEEEVGEEGKEDIERPDSEHESEEEEEEEEDEEVSDDSEVLSMDTPTFNAQHNDICEVCDEAGELLMCGTCNLVFHLECVKPKMDRMPAAERQWRCSYCILATHPKRSSKPYKQAAAAIRLMARLRKQHERHQETGE
jgi:hypothetical protein